MANLDYTFNFQNADSSGGSSLFPGDSVDAEVTGNTNARSTYQIISEDYNGDNTYTVVVRQIKFGTDGEAGVLRTVFSASTISDTDCNTKTKDTPLEYTQCNPNWDVELI